MSRMVVAGLVLAVLASSCASPTGEQANAEPTRWAGISEGLSAAREVADGSLPPDVALDLFASIYGDVPGATPRFPEVRPGDGTLAARSVGAYWEDLTEDQRDAIQRHLGSDEKADGDASPSGSPTMVLAAGPGGSSSLASSTTTSVVRNLAQGADDAVNRFLQRVADEVAREFSRRLGTRLSARLQLRSVPSDTWDRDDVDGDAVPMRDGSVDWSRSPDTCQIRINESVSVLDVLIAHEVFHCYQYEMADLSVVARAQDWIIEGSAEWAAATVGPPDETTRAVFDDWSSSRASLFALDYEAVGYFWTIESLGVDPWSVIGLMVDKRGPAAVDASGLDRGVVAERMATGPARRSLDDLDVDELWDLTPPKVPEFHSRTVTQVASGSPLQVTSGARGWFSHAGLVVVEPTAASVELDLQASVGAVQLVGGDLLRFKKVFRERICLPDGGPHQILVTGARVEPGPVRFEVQANDTPEAAIECWVDEIAAESPATVYEGHCPPPDSVPYQPLKLCSAAQPSPDLASLPWKDVGASDEFYSISSLGDFHVVGFVRIATDPDGPRVVEFCIEPVLGSGAPPDCEER